MSSALRELYLDMSLTTLIARCCCESDWGTAVIDEYRMRMPDVDAVIICTFSNIYSSNMVTIATYTYLMYETAVFSSRMHFAVTMVLVYLIWSDLNAPLIWPDLNCTSVLAYRSFGIQIIFPNYIHVTWRTRTAKQGAVFVVVDMASMR